MNINPFIIEVKQHVGRAWFYTGFWAILGRNAILCDSAFEGQTSLFRDSVLTYAIL